MLHNGWVFFHFLSPKDVDLIHALPWVKGHEFLLLQCWQAGFNPQLTSPWCKIVWAKLLGLPLELWNHSTIIDIANSIGIFYFWDEGCLVQMDKKIAWVLVEVDFGGELLSTLDLSWESYSLSLSIDY